MQCDMCGNEDELFETDIEGGILNVCKKCSRFGKVLRPYRPKPIFKEIISEKEAKKPELKREIVQIIADDYHIKIKTAREKRGMKQEELAKKLAEKESLIQKMETGQFVPSIAMARKLEKHLKISLVEEHEETHDTEFRTETESLTIGDVIQIKKR